MKPAVAREILWKSGWEGEGEGGGRQANHRWWCDTPDHGMVMGRGKREILWKSGREGREEQAHE